LWRRPDVAATVAGVGFGRRDYGGAREEAAAVPAGIATMTARGCTLTVRVPDFPLALEELFGER